MNNNDYGYNVGDRCHFCNFKRYPNSFATYRDEYCCDCTKYIIDKINNNIDAYKEIQKIILPVVNYEGLDSKTALQIYHNILSPDCSEYYTMMLGKKDYINEAERAITLVNILSTFVPDIQKHIHMAYKFGKNNMPVAGIDRDTLYEHWKNYLHCDFILEEFNKYMNYGSLKTKDNLYSYLPKSKTKKAIRDIN